MTLASWFAAGGQIAPLEVFRQDGEFVLYRTWRERADGDRQAVLTLLPATEQPTPGSLNRLTHEYELRDYLDDSWAVRPLELVRERGRIYLVLDYPGGVPLEGLIGPPMKIGLFLRLAIALSIALRRLHERGLVHKDIKPSNILADSTTGQAWLTGFGIASRLPRQRQSPEPPEFIAGTLAYMAPEQTGRMNRSIDSRSDLYSVGVTFYQLLTGSLPFTASDPMEWVHCHIAKQPVPPCERLENVPAPVSAIIMKLLAKTAEERYQTAAGVESDLRRCLAGWENSGRIDEFPLGEDDTPDRLLLPEKLYGRASEIHTLLASFDRIVAKGTPELVLVSGYSGIGKSSVVNELHKVLVPPRGLFASGKFDQYKRDIPYATLAQAFQSLVRPLLSKPEAELRIWHDALCEALGPNGLLIVDLVPELKHIIGEQAPVSVLAPHDAQRRFQMVLRRFIGVFARPEHPLALFLDDLQWLDAATLDLLEDLLSQPDVQHLMLIGAYRDNEVDSAHPLMRKIEAIRKAGATVQEISLAPLAREDLQQLIADSLRCEPRRAASLARLLHEKTAGNAFFAIQFLSSLAEEGLLNFEHREARWSWDLKRIYAKDYTDNVVDLLVGKLSRLPVETRKALQQLACLGNSADVARLAMLYDDSDNDLYSDLREAVRAGLVLHSDGAYRFLHDRVQEAAYSLIPENLRAEAHLRIGRLLVSHISPEKRPEAIFEIVNQLNRGSRLITSAEERTRVAELNLTAGERAKRSTAYASALSYLAAGRALLTEESWDTHYEIVFSIEYNMAECELLTADMAAAENRLLMLAQRAKSGHHIAIVTRLRLTLYTALGRCDRAMEVSLEYLRRGGADWPPRATRDEVMREYDRIWSQLGSRQIEDLIDLPLMSSPGVVDTLDILTDVHSAAHFIDENFESLVICRMVNLSLEHGNSDASCFAYEWFGIIAGPRFGNYEAGFRFGQLGYDLVEKHGLQRHQARTYLAFGNLVMPRTRHLLEGRDLIRRAFDASYRAGDLTFVGYTLQQLVDNLLGAGDRLAEVQVEAENGLEFARRARFGLVIDLITPQLQLVRTLRGLTRTLGSFDDEEFDEPEFEQHLAGNPVLASVESAYWALKTQAHFFAGDYGSAVHASLKVKHWQVWALPLPGSACRFYSALSHAAFCDSAMPDDKPRHLEALRAHHGHLEMLAEHCPVNFAGRADLVAAEIARIEGRERDAAHLYEQAIHSAHANGFVHTEALAYELAARFYAACGFQKIAHAYLHDARYCYLRWGADGKVRQLDQLYPHLREGGRVPGPTSTIGAPVENLDLTTVIKVSQAVSGEIVLETLIDTLMRTALEHAGAQRGLLIVPHGGAPRVEAEATTNGDNIIVQSRQASVSAADLPDSVLHYVVRTQESVILDDASAQNAFSGDEYIRCNHVRSLLCLPLIRQTALIGVLYLENNLTPRVFTPSRSAVLKLIVSQAAISLENARLYADLRRSEAYLAKAQRLSRSGSFGWRPSNGEIYWSGETFRIFEFSETTTPTLELLHQRIHPGDDAAFRQVAERASRDAQDYSHEYRLRMPDGRIKHLYVVAHAVRDESGGLEYIGAVMDVTERKQAEDAREQFEQRLRQAEKMEAVGRLAAGIAHDFNNVLAGVFAYGEMLFEATPEASSLKRYAKNVLSGATRGRALVEQILAYSRSQLGKRAPIDIRLVVAETIELLRGSLPAAIRLEASAPQLPLVVIGDATQVHQVVMNLCSNAIQATSAGGTLRVALEAAEFPTERALSNSTLRPGHYVRLTVEDSGSGMDAATLSRIFEPFFTTKETGRGTGLGLSLVYAIVTDAGGAIDVRSIPRQGSTFTIYLPRARDALVTAEEVANPLPRGNGERVLAGR
jgi:predicted ATPase/signal transduction histidine kinase